jgi:C4-type Zn-finger protein
MLANKENPAPDVSVKRCPSCGGNMQLANRMPHPARRGSDSLMYECSGCGHRSIETVRVG